MSSYLTIARPAAAGIEVKHSRFLCTLRRVGTEAEARALVAALRKEHGDARHTCSAFVLGPTGAVQRSSDDGEPAGTAGAPMLEVLRGAGPADEGLSDVVAVVTWCAAARRQLPTGWRPGVGTPGPPRHQLANRAVTPRQLTSPST